VNASAVQAIGLFAALGGGAAGLLVRDPRLRYAALGGGLIAGFVSVAHEVWGTSRFETLRNHPPEVAVLAVAVLAGLVLLAAAMRRWPTLFPLLAILALPLRVTLDIGTGASTTSSLLVPLYAVIASGLIAAAWTGHDRGWPGQAGRSGAGLLLERILAAVLLLYAVQALYSLDVKNALENAAFFYVPFAALYALLREVDWSREMVRRTVTAIAAATAVLAVIGLVEYATRGLLVNTDLRAENALHVYFRVNSLFRDPNIFGRYLALAIVALAGLMAWEEQSWRAWAAGAVAAIALAALAFSFSLTSFAALLVGLLVLTWARLGTRVAVAAVIAGLLAGGVYEVAVGAHGTEVSSGGAGRTSLIEGGLDLARDRPVWGYGSGSFGEAFYTRIEKAKTTSSHDTPIAVAAEQGIIGFAVYAGLVIVALAALFGGGVRGSPARATLAALFVTMLVHTLGYASFLEDPATWAILAVGVALAGRSAEPPEAAPG
jgi:putative inorganic carbon (HCO3(-)) transporter